MTERDDIAPLLAWYAIGALDARESARVESHIAGCDACRDLLVLARGFRRLAPRVGQESLFDHVQSQRLVEFAEDPSTLEPDARRFIRNHVRGCSPCSEALEILEDMARAPASDDGGSRDAAGSPFFERIREAWSEWWQRLSRTLLHPAAALVYLALVVLLLFGLLRQPARGPIANVPPPPEPPTGSAPPTTEPPHLMASVVPPAVELPEEIVFRDGRKPPSPISVPLAGQAGDIELELVTSIEPEDLRNPASEFHLTLLQEDRVLFESRPRGAAFDRRGRLRLRIDTGAFASGTPVLARITRMKPGTVSEGAEVYRRSFILVRDDATK